MMDPTLRFDWPPQRPAQAMSAPHWSIARQLPPVAYFGVDVPQQRAVLHMASEAAAVGLAAPFLWWASNQTQDLRARLGLRALAVATVGLDGWLLYQWLAQQARTRPRWGLAA